METEAPTNDIFSNRVISNFDLSSDLERFPAVMVKESPPLTVASVKEISLSLKIAFSPDLIVISSVVNSVAVLIVPKSVYCEDTLMSACNSITGEFNKSSLFIYTLLSSYSIFTIV